MSRDWLERAFWDLFASTDLSDRTFKVAGNVHDWRNYVPDAVIEHWPELSHTERMLVAIVADVAADREEWE